MNEKYAEEVLTSLFRHARRQFGNTVHSHWFYGRDECPGCGFEVDGFELDGQTQLSINAFLYRERRVLIGYFLCGDCAKSIHTAAQMGRFEKTPIHTAIEANLVAAYREHLRRMDA